MLNVWDTGHEWVPQMLRAAFARGFPAKATRTDALLTPGTMFFIPNQFPADRMLQDKSTARDLIKHTGLNWIADYLQVQVYEDKIAQAHLWHEWMPGLFYTQWRSAAEDELDRCTSFPLVSKSAVGSASLNVRLLRNKEEAYAELDKVFGAGLPIRQGPGPDALQKGYVLWQNFIPHEWTWRVTVIGTKYHVYKRFNYEDRPMACPSKVKATEPAPMCVEVESLLEFSKAFFSAASTKWCAIDVLKDPQGRWRLLETSLAWARGNDASGNACFYGTKRSLNSQFDLLIDELERAPW